jgi:hypothetical protein
MVIKRLITPQLRPIPAHKASLVQIVTVGCKTQTLQSLPSLYLFLKRENFSHKTCSSLG